MLTFNLNGSSKEQTDLFVPVLIELFSWFWIVSALSPLVPSCDCVTASTALTVFHFSNWRKILKLRKHLHILPYFRFYNQNLTWKSSILYHSTVQSAFLLFLMHPTCYSFSILCNILVFSSRDLLFSLIIRISSIQHQQLHKLLPKQWSMFVQGAEILQHRLWTGIMTTAVMGKQPVNATLCWATFMTQVYNREFGKSFVAHFPTVFLKCICDGPVFIQQLVCCGRAIVQYIHLLDIVVTFSQHIQFLGSENFAFHRRSELKS